MSHQNSKTKPKNSKKAKKSETEGNILIFYAIERAASSVLKSKVSATKISFKSGVKASVQYAYTSNDKISKDQQKQIEDAVNEMLNSKTKVTCSKRQDKALSTLPDGIDGECQLYDVEINGQQSISHIPITANHLGCLSAFKMIKCNYKAKKNILEIFYSFKANNAGNENGKGSKGHVSGHTNYKYFDDATINEKDDRTLFSKEIVETILSDLKVENIDKEHLNGLLENVHNVLNRFQSVAYTKGFKAAKSAQRQ